MLLQENRLVIFLRYPAVGRVKTRLIPSLGTEGAALLYRRLAEHMIKRTDVLKDEMHIEFRCDGAPAELFRQWLGERPCLAEQGDGSLGERMSRTFADHFADKAKSVVLIGTDCPDISVQQLQATVQSLENHDLVLGPAYDGGYYLIGLSSNRPELFTGINWGESSVLKKTLAVAEAQGLRTNLLDTLFDIDRPEDLQHCIRLGLLDKES